MAVPPTSISTMFSSDPMPTSQINPMPTRTAAPMHSTVHEPMNLSTMAKLREKLHAYIGDRYDNRPTRHCYNCPNQGHLARDCQKNTLPSRGEES